MSSVRAVVVLLAGVIGIVIYMAFGTAVMPMVQQQTVDSPADDEVPLDVAAHQDRVTTIMFQWIPVAAFGTVLVTATFVAFRRRRVTR
jgi:hypothetical protein